MVQRYLVRGAGLAIALGVSMISSSAIRAAPEPYHNKPSQTPFLNTLSGTNSVSATTISDVGDNNPYGVAVVPEEFESSGLLRPGDIIVSDFNGPGNPPLQGTGRSIVTIDPELATTSTFFTASSALGTTVGLTTALLALHSKLVVVGNAPRDDSGSVSTVSIGSLIFLDQNANVVLNLIDSALLAGPWDMTADETDPDDPILYVSNVLTGTVTRIELHVNHKGDSSTPEIQSLTTVASGFAHRTDPAALVVGPTGSLLSHDKNDLYVADTGNNRIQFVRGVREARRSRGAGETIVAGPTPPNGQLSCVSGPCQLNGPLGLAWTPIGTIVLSNGDAPLTNNPPTVNQVLEFDPKNGHILANLQLDNGIAGALFGIAIAKVHGKTSLIYVDDNDNSLNVRPQQ